ncbi:MAG: prevent-host-death family protein [Bradyrhizobium sp.]|nr:prevent-host-death family protein [Bradyrhizobium sp.]
MATTEAPELSGVDPRHRWRLQDAKARFSEVVRLARDSGPQRVTLHGRDAVVVVSAETWDRERQHHSGRRLIDALAASPLADIDLERPFVTGPVRTIDL